MWKTKKLDINSNFNFVRNFLLNMLYFKKINSVSTAIAYKNRFLINKRSCKHQFLGLLINTGYKTNKLKLVNKVYLNFLHKFHNLNVKNYEFLFFTNKTLDMGEFINLYAAFYLFKNWDRSLIWRIEENLPIIKVISKKIKKKKIKKKIKKKKKFNLEYKYIRQNKRFQIALKWLSLIIKTNSLKIKTGLEEILIPFIINPAQSKYIVLKKKIYTNLLITV